MRQVLRRAWARVKQVGRGRAVSAAVLRTDLRVEALERRDVPSGTPLTYQVPAGHAAHAVTLRVNGTNLEILDNGVTVRSQSAAATSQVSLTGGRHDTPDTYTIQGTAAGVPFTLSLANAYDQVYVGNGGSVQGIRGSLTVVGAPGSTHNWVQVNDSADAGTHANVQIGAGGVTGLTPGPAAIHFQNVGSATIIGGTGGHSQYTVNSSPGVLAVTARSGTDSVTINSAAGDVYAYGQAGASVSLSGPAAGKNSLLSTPGGNGDPSSVSLNGAGYTDVAQGFGHVFAFSHAGLDSAVLNGAYTGVNSFSGMKTYSYLEGPGIDVEVFNFFFVTAHSHSTYDTADLQSAGGSFQASPGRAVLFTNSTYSLEADNFAQVKAHTSYTNDEAILQGATSGVSTFASNGPQSFLFVGDTVIEADGFTSVTAQSFSRGDLAVLDGRHGGSVYLYGLHGPSPELIVAAGGYHVTAQSFVNAVDLGSPTGYYRGNPFPAGTVQDEFDNVGGAAAWYVRTGAGDLQQLGPLGWETIHTGVRQFAAGTFGGYANSLFYLTTGGNLYADTGDGYPHLISTPMQGAITYFGVASAAGKNWLAVENGGGVIDYRNDVSTWRFLGAGFQQGFTLLSDAWLWYTGPTAELLARTFDGTTWDYLAEGNLFAYEGSW